MEDPFRLGLLLGNMYSRDVMEGPARPLEARLRWDIAESITCDIITFSGINLSGKRTHIKVFPSGVKGDVEGHDVQSVVVIAPLNTRVIFKTSAAEEGWEDMPWRTVDMIPGKVRANKAGKPAVNIPDLDAYNEPDAQRVDPDLVSTFAHVERIEDGKGWTFGHRGALKLKGNIRAVRIEKLPAKG
ncbi:MAG: hypothetical protein IPI35_14480 [Deltaproteobacteria bacterium]|nr:hypothetical protein [Deltaproteobacteria bacterium]